ncbi:MAG: Rqc2 family fibronectin-binding protein [Anaerolineae bacterium]
MYFDTLTLAAVRDELQEAVLGGRVQKIVQPSALTLGMEIFAGRRRQLFLSAESRMPRIHLVEEKLRRGTLAPSPMMLLLRKYVDGARLISIEQPSLERILRLGFRGEHGPVELVCETMGRYSNVILLAPDGTIMDAIKRVPPSLNRVRSILPSVAYLPPPPQAKADPRMVTFAELLEALRGPAELPLWRRLVDAVGGVSPIVAREVVFRATGQVEEAAEPDDAALAAMQSTLGELFRLPETHAWSPCLAYAGEGEERRVVAFGAYALTHLPDREPAAGISQAISAVAEQQQHFDAYRQVRERLRALIGTQVERQEARIASLRRSLVPPEEIEDLRLRATAILALAYQIRPGQAELVADLNLFAEGDAAGPAEPVRIPLDPRLSASENAQALFQAYHKRKAAADEVPSLIEESERELVYLQQLLSEVALAEDRPQLDEVEQELRDAGYAEVKKGSSKLSIKSAPLSVRAEDGTLILVGRNSRQNEEVTFHRSAPDDLWLHVHALPGAHVIVKSSGGVVDEGTLLLAARLATYHSGARGQPRVQVDWAPRRHVRRIPGGRPGMVTYSHEQTLVVEPTQDAGAPDEGEW